MKHALDVLEASFDTPLSPELIERLGLPGDKLEAAMVKYQVIPLLHAPARRFAVDMILEGESSTPFM